MTTPPSMPLFCGDYLKDTTELSLDEHGAYLKILMITWATGGKPLPDDDERMATRLSIPKDRWVKKLKPVLSQFFDLSGGTWRNLRLEREWEYVQKRLAVKRANGARGGRPRERGPGDGPKNGEGCSATAQRNTKQNGSANHMKSNGTGKPIGSNSVNLDESTQPPSAYADTEAYASGGGAPEATGNVETHPRSASGELFGPVLTDLQAACPERKSAELRSQLGKAQGHLGPDAALALAKQALLRVEPWNYLWKTIDSRIKDQKQAAGGRPGRPVDPAEERLLRRQAEEQAMFDLRGVQ